MIKMNVTGIKENVLRLRNIEKRVHENARKTMHATADRIVAKAKKMAPVDEHNLEDAITKQVGYEGSRRRLAIDVVIQPVVNGVRVEDYATYMHEGDYELGEKSQVKNDSQAEQVGPGFLTRAAEPEREKLQERWIGIIRGEINE